MFRKKDHPLEIIIGHESSVSGNIATTGVARIDGSVEGGVRADWLIIGDTGTVKGDVIARGTVVAGKIEGNIRSEEIVEVKTKGIVEGDIYTTKLSISEGATFDGRSFMRRVPGLEGRELLSLEKGGKKSLGAAASDGFEKS